MSYEEVISDSYYMFKHFNLIIKPGDIIKVSEVIQNNTQNFDIQVYSEFLGARIPNEMEKRYFKSIGCW
jgi:hypothetical protein